MQSGEHWGCNCYERHMQPCTCDSKGSHAPLSGDGVCLEGLGQGLPPRDAALGGGGCRCTTAGSPG